MPGTGHYRSAGRSPEASMLSEEEFLKAPIVLHPPAEYIPIPRSLLDVLEPSRKAAYRNGDVAEGMTSVADMVIYLYSYSMKSPMSEKWFRIYSYYADKLLGGILKKTLPFIPNSLSEYEEAEARRLRRMIFRAQTRLLGKKKRKGG